VRVQKSLKIRDGAHLWMFPVIPQQFPTVPDGSHSSLSVHGHVPKADVDPWLEKRRSFERWVEQDKE
jgi:hypothetical protein